MLKLQMIGLLHLQTRYVNLYSLAEYVLTASRPPQRTLYFPEQLRQSIYNRLEPENQYWLSIQAL